MEKFFNPVIDYELNEEGLLPVEINLDFPKRKILKALESILDEYAQKDKGKCKNLLGETKTQEADNYENILYVHKLKSKKYSYKKIYEKSIKDGKGEGKGFNSPEIVRNYYRRYLALEKQLPVPVVKK